MLTMDHLGRLAAIRQIATFSTSDLARILPNCPPDVAEGVRAVIEKRSRTGHVPGELRVLGLADPRRETFL